MSVTFEKIQETQLSLGWPTVLPDNMHFWGRNPTLGEHVSIGSRRLYRWIGRW